MEVTNLKLSISGLRMRFFFVFACINVVPRSLFVCWHEVGPGRRVEQLCELWIQAEYKTEVVWKMKQYRKEK